MDSAGSAPCFGSRGAATSFKDAEEIAMKLNDQVRRGVEDRDRVNVDEKENMEFWAKKLIVSEERLRDLVIKHGDRLGDIRLALDE